MNAETITNLFLADASERCKCDSEGQVGGLEHVGRGGNIVDGRTQEARTRVALVDRHEVGGDERRNCTALARLELASARDPIVLNYLDLKRKQKQ